MTSISEALENKRVSTKKKRGSSSRKNTASQPDPDDRFQDLLSSFLNDFQLTNAQSAYLQQTKKNLEIELANLQVCIIRLSVVVGNLRQQK